VAYLVETDVETMSAVVRFVGDTPYRSEEDLDALNALTCTAKQLQDQLRKLAKASDFIWLLILECAVRRHVFVRFEIESTGAVISMCARCYFVKFIRQGKDKGA
jgi:hypothetical protein